MSLRKTRHLIILYSLLSFAFSINGCKPENKSSTIALWTFDEQIGIYPSCVISDMSENDFSVVLGPGGQIVSGKYGNALEPREQTKISLPQSKSTLFGLAPVPTPDGRTVEPMNWYNANFCALMTSGENHLRKEVGFKSPTRSELNLGNYDWTVEFWFHPTENSAEYGTVFEIGSGPRGENEIVTQLILDSDLAHFNLLNQPSNSEIKLPTNINSNQWHHLAFVYHADEQQLKHFVNGQLQPLPIKSELKSLPEGDEDYLSIGRDGKWQKPLQGKMDELRFSNKIIYLSDFSVPGSFSYLNDRSIDKKDLKSGLPLLIEQTGKNQVNIGSRKHLFVDDLLIDKLKNVQFIVNPPRKSEIVMKNIEGSFRKHLNIIEDEDGLLRMYNAVDEDYLAVRTSRDGINWEIPVLPHGRYKEHSNVVIHEPTGMGMVFHDPNAPKNEKWKYLSGFHSRGVFIYSSADGYNFTRNKTAVLPFWAGSQSNIFYDEQQQSYISYHRADFARGVGQATQREFVMTETDDLISPWPFRPSTELEGIEMAKTRSIKDTPFYLDNGLLTPGGFAFEYPNVFKPIDGFDPIDTDLYVPKAHKYPWAPDVYLAFPVMYYHYKKSSPLSRSILGDKKKYNRGSGPLETQLSVSRDAKQWKRYPRPTYVGIGEHAGRDVHTVYLAQGMVRRGNEIWQYYFGETQYHSSHFQDNPGRGVYRLIQRLDGFVSIDSPYDSEGTIITRPFTFKGNKLELNIDTDATGYAQVGILDENGTPIPGWNVDDCIYINGDFINYEVEWIKNREELKDVYSEEEKEWDQLAEGVEISSDVSKLEGKPIRLMFRMRGSKLYSFQFVD